VSQIARTIANGLFLNEDLTEAIALGHDLGHTPFGHAGERALDSVVEGGFRHYDQSLRVVDRLEKSGKGLNLTYAVKNGIACHTNQVSCTREGNVVRLSDKIAYINHDIEDSIRANILKPEELPFDCISVLGDTKSKRITTLIASIIKNGVYEIKMHDNIKKAHDDLRAFLFANVYTNPIAKQEEEKVQFIIERLYAYYKENPDKMPEVYRLVASKTDLDRGVCDFISGMTDGYAIDLYTELYVPKAWK
jgi:dGTPase